MNTKANPINVISRYVPGFLLGRPRSQWKGVMVRQDTTNRAATRLISIDDVTGTLTTRSLELAV